MEWILLVLGLFFSPLLIFVAFSLLCIVGELCHFLLNLIFGFWGFVFRFIDFAEYRDFLREPFDDIKDFFCGL